MHPDEQVSKIVTELNSRLRAVLGWHTPFEVYSAASVGLIT
jgi:IS30 family transposase